MAEEKKYQSRMGDGSLVFMTEDEIRADMREGMADAVKRGKIDPMSEEDFERQYQRLRRIQDQRQVPDAAS